jgi:curli biogenesis system outer membrane secretion channel CsgG
MRRRCPLPADAAAARPGLGPEPAHGPPSRQPPHRVGAGLQNTVTQQTWWWRANLKEVLSEQELSELGIVRKGPNAAQKGQMTGARYIVLGTVTSYDSNVESKTSGSNFGLLGFGKQHQQAETRDDVAIEVRVVDSSAGEVVGRRTVEGRATNTAEAGSQGVSLLPAAKALRAEGQPGVPPC